MRLSATAAIYVNTTALCVVMGVSVSIIYLTCAIYTITIAMYIELELYLINESPRVIANSVEAEFEVSGPVTGIRCVLRSQLDRLWKDCKTNFITSQLLFCALFSYMPSAQCFLYIRALQIYTVLGRI